MNCSFLLCATLLAPQGPTDWARDGVDPRHPGAVVVVGMPELSPREAMASAEAEARAIRRQRLESRGAELIEDRARFWLPPFVRSRALAGWVDEQGAALPLELLDREETVRDHGFGKSFQTHLVVGSAEPNEAALRRLARRLDREGQRFLATCGGTLGLWAVLAFAWAWFDRLSRGYMTGRLAAIAVAMGVVVPGVAFLVL
jgi:hypothetical protein